jgi:ADP-ribose pyrophosphatase
LKDNPRIEAEVLEREPVFSGRYLKLGRWRLRLPDGRETHHEIVEAPDAVAVLPLGEDGVIHALEHHRPAVERTMVELPAGLVDPGEEPAASARRELLEELGCTCERLEFLLEYAHAVGYSSGLTRLYLARGLSWPPDPPLDAGEFVRPVEFPLETLLEGIIAGRFIDTKLIIGALYLVRRYGLPPRFDA